LQGSDLGTQHASLFCLQPQAVVLGFKVVNLWKMRAGFDTNGCVHKCALKGLQGEARRKTCMQMQSQCVKSIAC
jgi:hypothetical protein